MGSHRKDVQVASEIEPTPARECDLRPADTALAMTWLAVALPRRLTRGAKPSPDCIPRLAMIPRPVDRLHYCGLSRRPGKDRAM